MPINYSNFVDCAGDTCVKVTLPVKSSQACDCTTWGGRINDLYFIDCSEEVSPANLIDTAWWTSLKTNDKIFNLGVGIGGYAKKNAITFDAGGCGVPTIQDIEWALTYQVFCMDKSSAMYTHEFANDLINGGLKNYNVIARFCDGDNMILPIGKVSLSDFNNELPTDITGFMSFSYEFSWKSMVVPTPLEVAGLQAVLPKATR